MPAEVERQLAAFGRTLEERTGEAIRPASLPAAAGGHGPGRRWWALGGAAACLVAVIVGLLIATRPPDDEPVASPATTTTSAPLTNPTAPPSIGLMVPDDPLALARDGWSLERVVDVLMAPDSVPAGCSAPAAPLVVVPAVHDLAVPPEGPELSVDLGFFVAGSPEREIEVLGALEAVARCVGEQRDLDVETTSLSSIRATWYRVGPDFAVGSVFGGGELAVVFQFEGSVFADDLVAALAHRADQFFRGQDVVGAPSDDGPATTTIVAQDGPVVERGPAVGAWTFELPEQEPRWLVVDYWYDPGEAAGRHFTFSASDEPVAFS